LRPRSSRENVLGVPGARYTELDELDPEPPPRRARLRRWSWHQVERVVLSLGRMTDAEIERLILAAPPFSPYLARVARLEMQRRAQLDQDEASACD